MPALLTLTAARNVPWAPTINLFYAGGALPLAGATISMQVRLYPGQPEAPLLDLPNIPFEDRGAATTDAPLRRVLTLLPVASRAALGAMPTGLNKPEAGEADQYVHDIVITYADGRQDRPAAGTFLLEPGVTTYV